MSAAAVTDTPCLRIDGEMTIYRAAELCDALKGALDGVPEGGVLEIDLSDVSEIDSAGVQLLMATQKTARATRRALRIASTSSPVADVFAILRLEAQFADLSPSPATTS